MATQKVVRAIQKVRQKDGTYLPVLPINTSDEVYTDIANKKTLKQELGEMVYRKNTVTANGSSVTTFRDPLLYVGPDGAISGDINVKLPIAGSASGVNVSVDMSISGSDHVIMNTRNTHKVDVLPGAPGPSGETSAYCSDMSALGNVLVVSGGGETYGVSAYKVYNNNLTSIDLYGTFNGPITKCSVSEDGTFLALMDATHIHAFFRLNENMYYQSGSVAVENIDTVSCIKVTDPFRTINGGSNPNSRAAIIIVGYNNKRPITYSFTAFSAPVKQATLLDISDIALDIKTSPSGTSIYIRTATPTQSVVIYEYTSWQSKFTRSETKSFEVKIIDSCVSPSDTYYTCIFTDTMARVYPVDAGTTASSIIKQITFPTNMIGRYCRMLSDTKIIFWGYNKTNTNVGMVCLYDLDIDRFVNTDAILSYIGGIPDNIFISANAHYGFIVKGNTVQDSTPTILPFEYSSSNVVPSLGINGLEMLPTRFVATSNDGKYIAMLPKSSMGITSFKIFKEINNSYIDITPPALSQITETDVVSLTCTETADTFALVTTKSAYVYRRDLADAVSEILVDTGTVDNTCSALTESYNGYYILYIGKVGSPFIMTFGISQPSLGFEVSDYDSDPFAVGAITTKVIGIGAYNRYTAYVATVDSSDPAYYNIASYRIGGNTLLSDKVNMNTMPIPGEDAKVDFSISRNGEYVVAVDKTNKKGTFYCRDGSSNLVEMGFDDIEFADFTDAVFDNYGRFLYILNNDNSITCYDIRDGADNKTKVVSELTTYSDSALVGLNRLLITDSETYSKLFATGYSFPYITIFDIDVISGFVDVNLCGTILTENRTDNNGSPYTQTLWKNLTLTHNNPKLIADVRVGTDPVNGLGIVAVKSFDEKWIDYAVQINRLSVYGIVDNEVDYTNITVSNQFSNQGNMKDMQSVQNSMGVYRDMNIIGTGTINGDQIVGVTRLKNIVISKDLWIDEKIADGGYYRYRIPDRHITADSMVNIDIKTPADLTIASVAGIQSITVEGDGYVDIYATSIPTANITVDVNIFR